MRREVVDCELCRGATVQPVRTEESGAQVWVCSECGDLKRWCTRCDQGWLRRLQITGLPADVYSCDECDATYPFLDAAGTLGQDLQSYLDSRVPGWHATDIAVVRERQSPASA